MCRAIFVAAGTDAKLSRRQRFRICALPPISLPPLLNSRGLTVFAVFYPEARERREGTVARTVRGGTKKIKQACRYRTEEGANKKNPVIYEGGGGAKKVMKMVASSIDS